MDKKILIGRQPIMEYIGISHLPLFQELLRAGMPARAINNRWYAHVDNLEAWFQKFTNVRQKDPPPDAE